jgi:DNA (cytosine-5)-methyltransferase 1
VIYGSVCSGIEAATVAWHPLDWHPAWFAEIDPFASAVLAHRFPEVPNRGDFTQIPAEPGSIDVLVGGTPCQGFSVAGLRKGLADDRSNLALEFLRLADRTRPQWLVWENVPGVLSSNEGRDLGAFLGGLAELGYGWAYRVLDAQYFGLAQRRQRLFLVGYLGDWRPPAAVLLERESLSGNTPPSREAGKGTAQCFEASTGRSVEGRTTLDARAADGPRRNQGGVIVAFGGNNTSSPIDVATARNGHSGSHGRLDFESETFIAHTLRGDGFDASEDGTGRGTPIVPIAFNWTDSSGINPSETVPTLRVGTGLDIPSGPAIAYQSHNNNVGVPLVKIRRLTPLECERLQGFPDHYTNIIYRGKPASDGPRYKSIGNSMPVPVMRWIGERLMEVARHSP